MLCIVLDTNVLPSGIAYPASVQGKILAAWRHGSIEELLSDYIRSELRRVLPRLAHRHRHRHGLSAGEIDDLEDALSIQAEVIEPAPAARRTCATRRTRTCPGPCWRRSKPAPPTI